MSTEHVLTHHLESFAAGDLDEIMTDYTEDSVVIVPDATHRGVEAIRSMFEFLFAQVFIPDQYEFDMARVEIEEEIAYIVWKAKDHKLEVPLGTDTFLVRDDKILVQTFAAHIVMKGD